MDCTVGICYEYRSHLIDPVHLRNDDFTAFFDARIKALSTLVTDAMGKPVVEEHGTNEQEVEIADVDGEVEETEENM